MITNAVCRVFRSSSGGLVCVGEYPCMKQEVKAAEVKKYGEERADSAAVYIPDISADVMNGDFLFFGVGMPTERRYTVLSGWYLSQSTITGRRICGT